MHDDTACNTVGTWENFQKGTVNTGNIYFKNITPVILII